ncbi:MAG TPA: class I SAM-dependent methyltransferase [Streptosporangiaceae bacterium]|nr:class I SAM-dependent methyltransferase [Streptosporangiaceae bacterium]
MDDKPRFAKDLFRGSAEYYDRYRLPYPAEMIQDLVRRAGVSGEGCLLDLACGTGQLAFALRRWFREVWAVDQEPDMVELVQAKAAAGSAVEIEAIVSSAETLAADPDQFDLVVIGNAFHRLDRDLVASRVLEWLKPGGHLALCWSSQPWSSEGDWERALAAMLARWQAALGAQDRIPANWDAPRKVRPDVQVLADAGFDVVGQQEFAFEHHWTLAGLGGLVRSTSFLSAPVLGDQGDAFDADLAAVISPYINDGVLAETMSFAYDLARKPLRTS